MRLCDRCGARISSSGTKYWCSKCYHDWSEFFFEDDYREENLTPMDELLEVE